MPKYQINTIEDFLKLVKSLNKISYNDIAEGEKKVIVSSFVLSFFETYFKHVNDEASKVDIDEDTSADEKEKIIENNKKEILENDSALFTGKVADYYLDKLNDPNKAYDLGETHAKLLLSKPSETIKNITDSSTFNTLILNQIEVICNFAKETIGEEETLKIMQQKDVELTSDIYYLVNSVQKEEEAPIVENKEEEIQIKKEPIEEEIKPEEKKEEVIVAYTSEYLDQRNYDNLLNSLEAVYDNMSRFGSQGYENVLAELKNKEKQANIDRQVFKRDKQELERFFCENNVGSPEYMDVFKELVCRMVQGDKPLFITNTQLYKLENNYEYATKYLLAIIKEQDPIGTNHLEIDDIDKFVDEIKNDPCLKDKSLAALKERATAREYITNQFKGCNTPEEYQAKFSLLVDDVLAGKMKDDPLFKGVGDLKHDARGVGLAAGSIIKLMQKSYSLADEDSINRKFKISSKDIRKICDTKLDGELVSQELESEFKEALNQRPFNKLSIAERGAVLQDNPDREDPLFKVATDKLDGVRADKEKDYDMFKDALSIYARMNEIHSKRSSFFWLWHPIQNYKEYKAIGRCEDTLKKKYNFTDRELNAYKKSELFKKTSIDGVNQASILSKGTQKYNDLMNEYDYRKGLREDKINEPLKPENNEEKELEKNSEQNKLLHNNLNNTVEKQKDKNKNLVSSKNEIEKDKGNLVKEDLSKNN